MTSKYIVTFIFLFLFGGSSFCQPLNAKWSNKEFHDNKKDGFFSTFLGGNSRFIYALYANKTKRVNKERLRIVAFDQTDMRQLTAVTLVDRRDEAQRIKYRGLKFSKTIIYEKRIIIIWKKDDRLKYELYAEVYDDKLQLATPLTKIYETREAEKSSARPGVFVSANKNFASGFIVGSQYAFKRDSGMTVEYTLIDSVFSPVASGKAKIEIPGATRSDILGTVYHFAEDATLHIETRVLTDNARDNTRDSYTIYALVHPKENIYTVFPLQFSKKNVFDVGLKAEKGVVKIFGFFCDIEKDPRGEATHGIFYALVDASNMKMLSTNFSYFSSSQLADLFQKGVDDGRSRNVYRSRAGGTTEESLGSFYQIEDVQSVDSTDIVLFCSVMRNISRLSCDNRGVCITYYYCQKSNVTAFRIAADGRIVWASNLERFITYDGLDVRDVHVIRNNKTFYVTYGSMLLAGKERKSFFGRKSARHTRDYFEYAMFDYETGKFQKTEIRLNEPGTSRKEIKTVFPLSVQVVNNKFYVHSIQTRPKPWVCATGPLIPVYIALLASGNSYRAAGYLGTITF